MICSVTSYSAPVSCVARSNTPNAYYLGMENGNLLKVDMMTNRQDTLDVANGRVYSVYEESDSLLWIGVRDGGLKRISWVTETREKTVKCEKEDHTLREKVIVRKEKEYRIRVPDYAYNKEPIINYGVYHIAVDKDGRNGTDLYLSTSSGVYRLRQEDRWRDTLEIFYRPAGHKYKHFGVNASAVYGDRVYMGTKNGLVMLEKTERNTRRSPITTDEILYMEVKGGTLYASSKSAVHRIDPNTGKPNAKKIRIGKEDLAAYIVDSLGDWRLTSTSIWYNNKVGLELPHGVNYSYKNYITEVGDFILLGNGNSLYMISKHQNPKGDPHDVLAACDMDGDCYFITNDNSLHKLPKGKEESAYISKLRKLDKGEKIVELCASEKHLWFITDRRLYRVNPRYGSTRVIVGKKKWWDKDADSSTQDFRSIACYNSTMYAGTRYSAFITERLNNGRPELKKIEMYALGETDSTDLYITDILANGDGKYFSTLNKQIFTLAGNEKLDALPGTLVTDIGSTKKMIGWSGKSMYTLTTKGLYLVSGSEVKERYDHDVKYIATIVTNSNHGCIYLVGYQGVGVLDISGETGKRDASHVNGGKGLSYMDISFNTAAVVPQESSVLLGSKSGLYKYGNGGLESVTISPPGKAGLYLLLLIVLVALAAGAGWLWIWYKRSRMDKYTGTLAKMKTVIETNVRREARKQLENERAKLKGEIVMPEKKKEELKKILSTSLSALSKNVAKFESDVQAAVVKTHEVADENLKLAERIITDLFKYEAYIKNDSKISSQWDAVPKGDGSEKSIREELNKEYNSIKRSHELLQTLEEISRSVKKKIHLQDRQTGMTPEMELALEDFRKSYDRERGQKETVREFEKELRNKSDIFFEMCEGYIDSKKWGYMKKIVACIYLVRPGVKPREIVEVLAPEDDKGRNDLTNRGVSALRGEINSEMEKKLNALQKRLYERTKSTIQLNEE